MRDARKWKNSRKKMKNPKTPSWEFFVYEKFIRNFLFTPLMTSHDDEQFFIFKRFSEFFILPPQAKQTGGELLLWQKQIFSFIVNRECYCFTKWKCENLNILSSSSRIWVFIPLVFSSFVGISPTYRQIKICEEVSTSCNKHISIQFHILLNAEATAMEQ